MLQYKEQNGEESTQELPAGLDLWARGGGREAQRMLEGWRKGPKTLERQGEPLGIGSVRQVPVGHRVQSRGRKPTWSSGLEKS